METGMSEFNKKVEFDKDSGVGLVDAGTGMAVLTVIDAGRPRILGMDHREARAATRLLSLWLGEQDRFEAKAVALEMLGVPRQEQTGVNHMSFYEAEFDDEEQAAIEEATGLKGQEALESFVNTAIDEGIEPTAILAAAKKLVSKRGK